jgi:hypothetical protein
VLRDASDRNRSRASRESGPIGRVRRRFASQAIPGLDGKALGTQSKAERLKGLEALYELHGPAVYRCAAFVGDLRQAESVTIAVFVAAWNQDRRAEPGRPHLAKPSGRVVRTDRLFKRAANPCRTIRRADCARRPGSGQVRQMHLSAGRTRTSRL